MIGQLAPAGLALSAVSYMEAYQGIGRGQDPAGDSAALQALVGIAPILPFSAVEARRCARIRESLRQQGRRIHSRALDLMIAATAIEHDRTLVTRNRHDYQDVPGLMLYDGRP